jgi:hypothetical protein
MRRRITEYLRKKYVYRAKSSDITIMIVFIVTWFDLIKKLIKNTTFTSPG